MTATSTIKAAKAKANSIDKRAQEIVAGRLAGTMEDNEARWGIAALVHESEIAGEIARTLPSQREQYELHFALTELLESKIVDPRSNGFQFDLAQGASLCGWARKLARSALPSKHRDYRYQESKIALVPPVTMNGQSSDLSEFEFKYHSHQSSEYDQHTEEVLNRFDELNKNSRGITILHTQAQALSEGFVVPLCARPVDFKLRRKIVARLEDDPQLAAIAAMKYSNVHYGTTYPEPMAGVDLSEINGLFESYTLGDLDELTAKSPEVAHTLALSAVSDLPRPKKALTIEFHRNLGLAGSGRGWKSLVIALAESFIALECQTASAWHSPTDGRLAEMDIARSIAQRNWDERATLVAQWEGSPLGSTDAEVHNACVRMFSAVTNSVASPTSTPLKVKKADDVDDAPLAPVVKLALVRNLIPAPVRTTAKVESA